MLQQIDLSDMHNETVNKFRLLFELANDCLLLLSLDGRILDINHIGYERLGYTKEEMLGRRIAEFDTPEFADKVPERMAKIMSEGQAFFESAHVHKDGSKMPVEINARLVELNGEKFLFSVIRDITERKAAEEALKNSEAQYRAVIETSTDGFWIVDMEGRLLEVNDAYVQLSGYSREELLAMRVPDIDDIEKPEETAAHIVKVVRDGHDRFETCHRCKDGSLLPVEVVVNYWPSVSGRLFIFITDITERKKNEAEVKIAATAFESQEGMLITDANSAILRVNRAFSNITGYSAEEVIGKNPRILSSSRHDANFYKAMWESLNHTGGWTGEIWNRRRNGEIYPEHLAITAVKDDAGITINYVATLTDITMNKEAANEIHHLAFYDPLTRLPNRRLLLDRLQQALASSARSAKQGALLFIDLDNFKALNDTLGHDIGDVLLQQVAERLTACVREGDTVARLGGDEFVVMLEELSDRNFEAAEQTENIGQKILATLNQQYRLGTHEYHSTPSIGATLFRAHQQSIEELLKQADIAMYHAKNTGRNTLRFFDQQMQEVINTRTAFEDDLRKALENRQFQLHYQIQMTSLHIPFGAEGLIRWLHPERGLVFPAQFIPLAEETGLILPIGQWVLETACAQLKAWEQSALTRNFVLAVNVSARQFRQPDFVAQVQLLVQRHDINPNLLKLELTESILLENIEDTIVNMKALNEIGVQLSLDDFGTGYSSLQYLKRLPLDQLKIDQSFVCDIATDGSDKAIVRTIIAMAHSLRLDVIAEGVETEEQRQLLQSNGCNHYQGYLFGKPLPIEQFELLLKRDWQLK